MMGRKFLGAKNRENERYVVFKWCGTNNKEEAYTKEIHLFRAFLTADILKPDFKW
jgi:hypothetical protein